MSVNKKYEFTGETKVWHGITLRKIRAITDISPNVPKGTEGGYIEDEKNLDQAGDAWVSGDARVAGNARVYGNAWVSGDARVSGNARVYGNAGVSENAWVSGDARVYGNAWVSGDARVFGDARVAGNARVSGDAWVYGNAWVYGDAWVSGNARVYGNARVSSDADWLTIGPIGSRNAFITFTNTKGGIYVACGCFWGTLESFREQVQKTHGDSEHGKAYLAAIEIAKCRIKPHREEAE